jgi:DNA-binding protein WhiA
MENSCCPASELAAVIRTSGSAWVLPGASAGIKIVTENAAFARRVFTVTRKVLGASPSVMTRKRDKLNKHITYILDLNLSMLNEEVLKSIGVSLEGNPPKAEFEMDFSSFLKNPCCIKAYLRGAFLAAGSISDPEKTYHLEISNRDAELTERLAGLMEEFGLKPKIINRKGSFILYLKEGENIVDFLNITGAHRALMELENIRILKEMRNNVNRIVNCETANLGKTVNASVRQVENIKYLQATIGFNCLPEGLREVAELRLRYVDASLKELGEMLSPPLGKSGVNHRLRKLDRIAEDERKKRGDL